MSLLYIYLHVFPSILLCCSTVLPECNNSACSTTSSSYHIILHRILSTDVIFSFCLYVCIVVVFIYFQTARHQKTWLLNSTMNWDFLKAARMQFRQRLKEPWNEFLTTKKKVQFLHDSIVCDAFSSMILRGRDRMVVGFIIACVISAYHH